MITICCAAKEDAPIVGKLVHLLLVELQHSSPNMNEAFYTAKATELLGSNQLHAFIARDSADKPIGVITIGTSSAVYAEGLFGIINELYVVPETRSAGVGRLLLNEAKKFASQQHWSRLEVTSAHEDINPRTSGFYLRENFTTVGARLKFEMNIS